MITSKDCWLRDTCRKYKNSPDYCSSDIFCIRLFKINELYNNALLTESQRKRIALFPDADGTDYDKFIQLKNIEMNIKSFVAEGKNLYLHSSKCGNGKTAWSIRMLQAFIDSIWADSDLTCRALFINVPKFFLALKDSISNPSEYINHIKEYINTADVVVWDEIGIKNCTQFEFENMLSMINSRIDSCKSNIYTSNLTGDELLEKVGERLYSRIINLSVDIELNGVDKRGLNK